MAQVKTSELTGAALDYAVAKCEGLGKVSDIYFKDYSSDWYQGGQIIEREGITITPLSAVAQVKYGAKWETFQWDDDKNDCKNHATGETPLIAAMRCYVASKLGDVVDVPDELL